MKKLKFCIMAIVLSLSLYPLQSIAANPKTKPATTTVSNPEDAAKIKVLELRLNEIYVMDKTDLKFAEKRELRKEVRSIKTQISEMGGGVYISVGAIIIILLLLIILL